MIVLRDLDNNGNECDQELYCDIDCFGKVRYGSWKVNYRYASLISLSESDKCNVYEDEHIIPNSHYPTINDFLSVDYSEYCYSCSTKLN